MIYNLLAYTDNNNLFSWLDNKLSIEETIFNGLAIIYKDKKYIFSIAHKLNPNSDIFLIDNDKQFKLELLVMNKDLDITIFTTDLDLNYYNIKEYTLNFNKDIIFRSPLYYKTKTIILNFNEIISTNIRILAPSILIVDTTINIDSDDVNEGCSGLAIMNNTKYIGLISCINKDNILIIPFINYLIFIDNKDKNKNLCYFYEKLKNNKNNISIKKSYNDVFNDKDKLIQIDDKDIINGNIYCDILDIIINIELYTLLFKNDGDITKFTIIRNKQVIDINYINTNYNKLINIKDIYKTELIMKKKNTCDVLINLNLLEYYLENNIKLEVKHPKNFIENIQQKKKIYKFTIKI